MLIMMMAAMLALGIQSALFAPVKLAIVPELVSLNELPRANGLLQTATQAAIIIGMLLSGCLQWGLPIITVAGMALALTGYLAEGDMPVAPAAASESIGFLRAVREVARSRYLSAAILVSTGFWMVAAAFQLVLVNIATDALGLKNLPPVSVGWFARWHCYRCLVGAARL